MSTYTTTTTTTEPAPSGVLKLRGHHDEGSIEQALEDLETKGYAIVKGVVPEERAKSYEDRMYTWLESFGKGFKRDDKETWKLKNLPAFNKGGLFNRHGAAHEQFAWDIRSEQGVIDAFAKIWGTDELLVSFDAVNLSLPWIDSSPEIAALTAPWPHVDQSPRRGGRKHCVQGIVNLAPNGPNDGGLTVLAGSLPLYNEFFAAHPELEGEGWPERDFWSFREEDIKWFEERGCKWVKTEVGPGDLILWDSRCIHYGAAAQGDRPRVATYVCYKPAKDSSPEKIEERKAAFAEWSGTTHDPLEFFVRGTKVFGPLTPDEVQQPHEPAVLTERAKKLAGLVPY
ncbi:hypothetical protein IAT38_008010 [Cryptococcus sp. DSM 104549]